MENKILSNKMKICENCEWCYYKGMENEFPKCMITQEQKGLVEYCEKFKYKTGEYFTFNF